MGGPHPGIAAACLLLLTALPAERADGAAFYVRATCRESPAACAPGDGSSPASAFGSIAAAAAAVRNAGDEVIVGPGTYEEGNISPPRSGVRGRPVVFRGDPSGSLTGDPPGAVRLHPPAGAGPGLAGFRVLGRQYILIEGFTLGPFGDPAIQVRRGAGAGPNSSEITIRANTIEEGLKSGIEVVAVGPVEISGNTVIAIGGSGITVQGCDSPSALCDPNTTGKIEPTIAGNLVDMSRNQNGGHGILVVEARYGLIEDNDVNDSPATGISLRRTADMIVRQNRVEDSARTGIEITATGFLEVTGNRVLRSAGSGLSVQGCLSGAVFCDPEAVDEVVPTISNNVFGDNGTNAGGHGISIFEARDGLVQNNFLFSNRSTGLTLRDARNFDVVNNLAYDNREDGFAAGTANRPAPGGRFVNNTVYANGGWGLTIGSQAPGSSHSMALNNIFQGNGKGGITVSREAACGWISGFNVNPDGTSEQTRSNLYDTDGPALFVNPAGPDGILGGRGWEDDDFRLQQGLGGQGVQSPGVDAGSALVSTLGLTGTTATGNHPDTGIVDAGFHYHADPSQRLVVEAPFMPVFVRKSGNDGNDGRTPDRALASIRAGAARTHAGVTLVVGPGNYDEWNISLAHRAGKVTLLGDRDGRFTGDVPGPVLVDVRGVDSGFILLDVCEVSMRGFHVTGAFTAGIQVRSGSDGARVEDNVVFGNQRRGIQVLGADGVEVVNNLVYANGTGGIRISASSGSSVLNNTSYGNGEVGILVDGGSATTRVARNVTQGNFRGVLVNADSLVGYASGNNVVAEGFTGHTPNSESDVVADPLFVRPAGFDGILGGLGFEDDDFRLRQDSSGWSPAVDLDFEEIDSLAWSSTRPDDLPDLGPADAGFHYPLAWWSPIRVPAPRVFFVRRSGSDSGSGRTPSDAFATLKRALEQANGDAIVVVGPGRYESRGLRMGIRGRMLAVIGDPSGEFTGDAPGLVLLESSLGSPRVRGPVLLRNLVLAGGRGAGVSIDRDSGDVTLRDTVICGNRGSGLVSRTDGLTLSNVLVTGNGRHGLDLRLRQAARPTRILNATIAGNLGHGMILRESRGKASGFAVVNNVIAGNKGIGIRARMVATEQGGRRNNLNADGFGARVAPAPSEMIADPRFAGGTTGPRFGCESFHDFSLRDDSPAIDAGVGAPMSLRLNGRSVVWGSGPDIGLVDLGFHFSDMALPVPTRTVTPTPLHTFTRTPTRTSTRTRTRTATQTQTPSPTGTPTPSRTPTATPSAAHTSTASPTTTAVPTASTTSTAAPTPTSTATVTVIVPPTTTATPTFEPTATETPEPTATFEPTATETPEPTATLEPTATETPEPTATLEPTATETPEPTATFEPTATETPEPTATFEPTATETPEPTATFEPTATETPEPTATFEPTATETPEPTATLEPTGTETAEPTATATAAPASATPTETTVP